VAAIPAIAIHAAHPGDAYSRSHRQLGSCTLDHLSDNLVAGHELLFDLRQVALNDVQVCATDPASNHTEQDMPGFKLWPWNFLQLEERSWSGAGR
jgi:hypothetical protein